MSSVGSTTSQALLAAAPFIVNIGLLVVGFGIIKYLAKTERTHWQAVALEIRGRGEIVPAKYDDRVLSKRLEHSIHVFEAGTIGLVPVLALVLIPSISANRAAIVWTAIGMFVLGLLYFLYMLSQEVEIDDTLAWNKRMKSSTTIVGCVANVLALGIAVGVTVSS